MPTVPLSWIGRRVEVRESKDKIDIQLDARSLVAHRRVVEPLGQRVTLQAHRREEIIERTAGL